MKRTTKLPCAFTLPMLTIAMASAIFAEEADKAEIDLGNELRKRSQMIQKFNAGGWPPLFHAVKGGRPETVKTLLKEGAKPDFAGSWKHTILHIAAASGSQHPETAPAICRLLVEAGADINAASKSRVTPLHEAALSGSAAIVELLIDRGADVNTLVHGSGHCLDPDHDLAHASVFGSSDQFRTALDYAKAMKHAKIVALLKKHGAKTGLELLATARDAVVESELPADAFQSEVLAKAISRDGRIYAIYYRDGWDETISVHEAKSDKLISKFLTHGDNVRALSFSPDGRHLASSSANKGFALWDVSTGKLLLRLPAVNKTDRWAGDLDSYGFHRKGTVHRWVEEDAGSQKNDEG